MGHLGIYIDAMVFVGALIDFEQGSRFSRVVDHHPNLTDLHLGFHWERILIQETGKQRVFDKLASPDSLDEGGYLAAADHFRQSRADDVVFDFDFVPSVFRFRVRLFSELLKELRKPLVEFDYGSALP